ncbi:hypothetical protein RF11_10293 [Thelohanellus kitauei]|uniref:Uncharacterized protein n=1 Tax=Thelohanellus kitauei TaxID=669202 RepID=A0A0C2MTZ0_THEKT|nr:hypothetical protein RF11_10293 [Thelohanellus kitauei]
MKRGEVGDIITLLPNLFEIELKRLPRFQGICNAVLKCARIALEQIKLLDRDGVFLMSEEVIKHMKYDPIEKIIEGTASTQLKKTQTASSLQLRDNKERHGNVQIK